MPGIAGSKQKPQSGEEPKTFSKKNAPSWSIFVGKTTIPVLTLLILISKSSIVKHLTISLVLS